MGKFFNELKRRNVVRVGLAYVVVGWLVFQISEILFPVFGTPDWVFKTLVLLIALGLPFALIFAWAFELTPDGVKKTRDVSVTTSVTASTGRKLNFVIIAALVIALSYFIWERQTIRSPATDDAATVADEVTNAPDEAVAEEVVDLKKRSIAVIPFVNMSSDKEQEWFADGLTEEILNSLARTPDLLVSARTSSFAYKGSGDDVQAIAKALGVEHVLEGSVRRSGERLRVTAQLIRANDGFHLWSETYDRTVDDLIDIQENVAIEIANALETAMDPEALAGMVSSGTSSVPAYEAYLQGLSFRANRGSTGDEYMRLRAGDAFERAVKLDPEYSSAYWQLALFWYVQNSTTVMGSGLTELSRADLISFYESALDNAIKFERDPVNKKKYQTQKAYSDLNFPKALRLNTSYLESRPNDQQSQSFLLTLFSIVGQQQSIAESIAAVKDLNGYDPDFMTLALSELRHDHEALRKLANDAVARFDGNADISYQAHRAFLWVGDIDSAARLIPIIESSDLDEENKYLVSLRQACAENRIEDAIKLQTQTDEPNEADLVVIWLGHLIMGNEQEMIDLLMPFDEDNDMQRMTDFLTYASFDPAPFPNLTAFLASQGIGQREIILPPYQCRR